MIKKAKEVYQSTEFQGRSFRHYGKEAFQKSLYDHNWGRLYGCLDVNDTWDIVFKKLLHECDLLCPVKDFHIRKDHPPWFNNDILEMTGNRDTLYKEGWQTKDNHVLSEARKLKNLI